MAKKSILQITVVLLLSVTNHALASYPTVPSASINASAPDSIYDTDPDNTIDGSGMTGDLHNNDYTDMWMGTAGGGFAPYPGCVTGEIWIAYEFDQVYELGQMWLWNYNNYYVPYDDTEHGFKDVSIQYSTIGGEDGSNWSTIGGLGNTVSINKAPSPGLNDYAHNTEVDFGGARAKYVVITPNFGVANGWWGPDNNAYLGLSEVRFFGKPAFAENPGPAQQDNGVSPNADLTWTQAQTADSHDVYFGTSFTDVSNARRQRGDINGDGNVGPPDLRLVADQWTTDPTGSQFYADITGDNTVNFADLAIAANDWEQNAVSQFKGNQQNNYYSPTLEPGQTYYWRIDEVNGPDTWINDVWSFTVAPLKAWDPDPPDGGKGLGRLLRWSPGCYAAQHDIYLGTSFANVNSAGTSSDLYMGRQTDVTYDTNDYNDGNGLDFDSIYYWRIDEVNASAVPQWTGDTWSFTKKRRVIFNSDGYGVSLSGSGAFNQGGTVQQKLNRWISYIFDPLDDTPIDTLSWCDGSGGNTALYGSEVLEPWGFRFGSTEPTIMQWIAEGNDPAKVVVEEGHKRGLEVWYSFRINDIHDFFIPQEFPTFKQDNPDWMIGEDTDYGYWSALKFDVCDVRDIKFDTIVEMFTKYDFDGIELDFLRGPPFFMPYTEPANAHILTSFMQRVRTRLNELEIQRGRDIVLAARVDENLNACYLDGFDVESWVLNDSIDILILGSGVLDIAVEQFKAITG